MSNYYYALYEGQLIYKKRSNAKWRYIHSEKIVDGKPNEPKEALKK